MFKKMNREELKTLTVQRMVTFASVTRCNLKVMKAEKELQELRKELTEANSVNERAESKLWITAREMIEESKVTHLLSSIDRELLGEKGN